MELNIITNILVYLACLIAVMENSELSEMDYEASMESIHRAIKTLLKAHPTSISVLRNAVCDKFPHKVFPVAAQSSYIKQLLQLTSYLPSLRKDILELIIDRIVQIDVCENHAKLGIV